MSPGEAPARWPPARRASARRDGAARRSPRPRPEQAARTEPERYEEHDKYDDQPGIGADELDSEGFGDTHHEARDEGPSDIAERSENHRDECHQHKDLTDHRISGKERHEKRACGA